MMIFYNGHFLREDLLFLYNRCNGSKFEIFMTKRVNHFFFFPNSIYAIRINPPCLGRGKSVGENEVP